MNVIDVSHWQGDIDFVRVKANDTDGCIIKAGGSDDGFYTDSKFEQNYVAAKAAGLQVGAYYFVGPNCKGSENGAADANRFINILAGKQFDLPVYIDFEAPNGANKELNTDAVIGFCETMENNGFFVGVYASDISGFKDRLNKDRLTPYTWWVARYGSEPVYATNWDIWQYSSDGSIAGINGRVDLNNCRTNFHDTIVNGGFNGYGTPAPAHSYYVGQAIYIKPGAVDLNRGCQFASFVYETPYTILELQECGVVFGNDNGVTGVISYNDIIIA